ncbi:hypothetical protein D3C76_1813660 [compost metagenome]
MVDRPRHACQYVQGRVRNPRRALADHPRLEPHRFAITKALGQPREHSLRGEVKDRLEVRTQPVSLALGVVVDVAGDQLFVQG